MGIYLIDKVPLLRICRVRIGIRYGMIDYHDLIDRVCNGVAGKESDKNLLHRVKYSYRHHLINCSAKEHEQFNLVLRAIRDHVVGQLRSQFRDDEIVNMRYVRTGSLLSVAFQISQ